MNRLPALNIVVQRPRDLAELKELRLTLLRTAWREKTNADIAASIIAFIRQAALGDPLVAYEERGPGGEEGARVTEVDRLQGELWEAG
jgi:type I restriction enzyme, R subunit